MVSLLTARTLRLKDHQFEALDERSKSIGLSTNRYLSQLVDRDLGLVGELGFDGEREDDEAHVREYREGEIVPRAERYMRNIETGAITSCRSVQLSIARSRNTDLNEWCYHPERVNEVVEFIESLPHVKGMQAERRENVYLEDWQVFIVSEIFGWRRRSNPLERKYREYIIEVGRKNGKSTIMGGLALWELMHGDAGAEIYSAATVSKQARVVFEIAQLMARKKIERSDWNAKELRVKQNEIVYDTSKYAPVSKKSDTLDGLNPSLVIIDEAAAITDPTVISVMDTALQARLSPLMVYITTAQDNKDTAYVSKREYLESILDHTITDERVGGLLYGLDENDDYRDQNVWIKANPNLNISLIKESLLAKVRQSDEAVDQRADIRIKHFNEWIDGNTSWIDSNTWKACAHDWHDDMLIEAPLFVGVDLAQTTDLCAISYLWQHGETKQYYMDFECWSTEAYLASLSESIRPVYTRAVDDGKLHVCPGRVIDYSELVDRLAAVHSWRWIMRVGIDPYNAGVFSKELERKGLPVSMVNQGIRSLNATTKRTRDLVIKHRLHHRGVEFMNWQVSNAKLYTDVNENHKVVKDENAPHRKIDAVIALLCAMKVAEEYAVVENRATVRFVPL